jgi:hypothetical protein
MLCKTGVALRARCCWLRVFGVSARCGMRKPNTRASVKPRPVQSASFSSRALRQAKASKMASVVSTFRWCCVSLSLGPQVGTNEDVGCRSDVGRGGVVSERKPH